MTCSPERHADAERERGHPERVPRGGDGGIHQLHLPPCASFNAVLDPYLSSLNTNEPGSGIVAVKYQMDWPAPGNDPSYNQDGETRRAYYGVTGISRPFRGRCRCDHRRYG